MKIRLFTGAIAALLLPVLFLNSCVKDTAKHTYTYTMYEPLYETKAGIRHQIKSEAPTAIQNAGKLVVRGNYIYLNEMDKGVHIIDNTDPAQPKNKAFINIPGNRDLAVKGNTLYADLYTNLIALDISDPLAAKLTQVIEVAFPSRYSSEYYNLDSTQIVVGWNIKDTTVTEKYDLARWKKEGRGGVVVIDDCINCNRIYTAQSALASGAGITGSMARFTIAGNRLYTVGIHESLKIFDISTETAPKYVNETFVSSVIETLFPLNDKLILGATNGMYIYDISNPDQPAQVSLFTHVQSCDPVIAEEDRAYVTLRSGTACNGNTNELEILDITNLAQPALLKSYPLNHPQGLSKDGALLFVCDDLAGLKIYDAANPTSLQLLKTVEGLQTYDVIAQNGIALVVAGDGLYQFDYSDRNNIRQISHLRL